MKINKILYYVFTGLISAMMVGSAIMYLVNTDHVMEEFTKLGFPTHIVYPLAIAKILGVIGLWQRFRPEITEWAYAAFFFEFVLASTAHLQAGDGEVGGAVAALVILLLSYVFYKRFRGGLAVG